MNFRLTSNVGALLKTMNQRKAAVLRELSVAARELAPVILAEDKQLIQSEIYDVPIPLKAGAARRLSPTAKIRSRVSKGKDGKWVRTGNLKRSETVRAVGIDIVLKNNANYALYRNALGTPAGRKIVSPGVRSVQWQAQAVAKLLPRIRERRRRALLRALERP